MNVTAVPTVPVVGPLMVTEGGVPEIAIVLEEVAVFALESVAVTETVKLPLVL